MSGAAPDRSPGEPAPDAVSESNGAQASKSPWWKKVARAYQRHPLLYGFFTLLGLVLLAVLLSPLFTSVDPGLRGSTGSQRTSAAQLHAIADNLRRMDEFGQAAYAELLRDSLNPWMRQLKPTGTWQPDPHLVTLMPRMRDLAFEQQRLRGLIAEKEKQLAGKQGPTSSADLAKERNALQEMRRQAQALEGNLGQYRQQLTQELAGQTFSLEDALVIEGAIWARDISNRLRNDLAQRRGKVDSLELAQELFDWTIRNVALDERDQPTNELAWESLLWGQASNPSRAWIFLELCRQQGLDAVMLAYRDPQGEGWKDWLPAVLAGEASTPNLYLFDHRWGIPIPGPGGLGVATLTQAIETPGVLSQLDVVRTYPVRARELKGVVARAEVSPHLLSRRMQILEGELRGPDHVVLSLDLSRLAARLQKIKGLIGLEAWPWPSDCLANSRRVPPAALRSKFAIFALHGVEQKGQNNEKLKEEHRPSFQELAAMEARERANEGNQAEITLETVQREQREKKVPGFLWRGRMLQFRGVLADADDRPGKTAPNAAEAGGSRQGAANVYHSGRTTDRELDEWRMALETDLAKVQQLRVTLVEKGAPPDRLKEADLKIQELLSELTQSPTARLERQFVRVMATYWLAQIAYERGSYGDAAEYFRYLRDTEGPSLLHAVEALPAKPATDLEKNTRRLAELVIKPKVNIWMTGANYNLARALEAQGRDAEAIEAYRADTSADQRPGSLYRARRLQEKLAGKTKAAGKKPADDKQPADEKKPAEDQKPAEDKKPAAKSSAGKDAAKSPATAARQPAAVNL